MSGDRTMLLITMSVALVIAGACSESQPDVAKSPNPPELAPVPAATPALADTALAVATSPAADVPQPESTPRQVRKAVPMPAAAPATAAAPTPVAALAPVAPVATPASTSATGNLVSKGDAGSEALVGSIDAGRTLPVVTSVRICTNTNVVGGSFSGALSTDVVGTNGLKIPQGSEVVFEITELKRSESMNDPIRIALRPSQVKIDGEYERIDASVDSVPVTRQKVAGSGASVKKSAIGAVLGFGLGKLLGKSDKDAAVMAVGAGAGTAAVAEANAKVDGCIEAGSSFVVHLTSKLQAQIK